MTELEEYLVSLEKVAIAYSGGIDSSFLLFVANRVLPKENVLAIIANGCMIPRKDYNEAIEFLKKHDFQYKEVPYQPLLVNEFRENHKERCYYCKKNLMSLLKTVAKENDFTKLLDGKNMDDLKVYRPGNKATEELGILSPLAQFDMDKKTIRKKAQELGIEFWNKPSNSCLATRFPYHTILTEANLKKAELSEEMIKNLGVRQVRVRVHGDIARIEVEKSDFEIILKNSETLEKIKKLGFVFITLDLFGLKSGSFDERKS